MDSQASPASTAVRIAAVEPWPGRLRDGGFAISRFLVVLSDDGRHRSLPVWLAGPDGDSLWQLIGQPNDRRPLVGPAAALAARLLAAASVTVTGVHLDDLDPAVTAGPEGPGASPPPAWVRVTLAQPATGEPPAMRLGYGLALAVAA